MSIIEISALPEYAVKFVGIPGGILILARYILKSPVIIAYFEKRKACHLSDNEVRITEIKAKSKENIANIHHTDPSNNSTLRINKN
jgi:hypothetical protein